MGDILHKAYEDENTRREQRLKASIDKLAGKGYEEIYLLLKDIQSDVQMLHYDDKLSLTRNQWAALSRINQIIKELV